MVSFFPLENHPWVKNAKKLRTSFIDGPEQLFHKLGWFAINCIVLDRTTLLFCPSKLESLVRNLAWLTNKLILKGGRSER